MVRRICRKKTPEYGEESVKVSLGVQLTKPPKGKKSEDTKEVRERERMALACQTVGGIHRWIPTPEYVLAEERGKKEE